MPKINLNTDTMSKMHYVKYGTHYREMYSDSSTYHLICDIGLLNHQFKPKRLKSEYKE